MTLNKPMDKFRILHSMTIEHYQFIEFHLEGIYALMCGKCFSAGLEDVEHDAIGRLLAQIKHIEKETQIEILPKPMYERLKQIRVRRNFWCHNCYIDMRFDQKTGAPKDPKLLSDDFLEAEEVRGTVYQLFMELKEKYGLQHGV